MTKPTPPRKGSDATGYLIALGWSAFWIAIPVIIFAMAQQS